MKSIATAVALLLAITPVVRASVNEALDALYDSGHALQSLAADVSLENVSTDGLGDKTIKTGDFVLQRKPDGDSRARVSFLKTKSGSKIFSQRHDYLLDGTDLVDRDEESKKQVTRQIRKPGEKVDFFKLGEGPFPLPIGQPRDEVLANFDVKEEKSDDPSVLAVVTLTPKPKTPMADNFKWIRVAVDRTTKLPSVITTRSANAPERNTVTLTNVRVNGEVKEADFALPPIKAAEWTLVGTK